MTDDDRADPAEAADRKSTAKLVLSIGGAALLGVIGLTLVWKVWAFFWSALFVVGVGTGVALVLEPRLARAKGRLRARSAGKSARLLEEKNARALDDELARLKKSAGEPS